MRRLWLIPLGVVAFAPALAASPQPAFGSLTVVIVSSGALPPVGAVALGVNPDDRHPQMFYRAVSAGGPLAGVTSVRPSHAGALGDLLKDLGVAVHAYGPLASTLVYGDQAHSLSGPPGTSGAGLTVISTPVPPLRPGALVLAATAAQTPVWVVDTSQARGLLAGAVSRRPGVVSPFDVTATILDRLGAPQPPSFIGRSFAVKRRAGDERAYLESLARRFERDAAYPQSLTAWTVVIGLGAGFFAAFMFAFARLTGAAARLTTGASFATAGFLAGMFVPAARGDVRALAVLAGLVAGMALGPKDRVRFVATLFVAVAALTAAIEIASALNPAGEPAISFWGDPLVSWRWYGLYNYQAAFVAGGILVGAVALDFGVATLVASVVAGLVVVGAPFLGANYVAVLVLAFGGAFAVLATITGRIRWQWIAAAGAIAVALFAVALAADRGAGTHGGAALHQIESGGAKAALTLAGDRLRLNFKAIRAFPGGVAWAILFAVQYVNMIRWSRNATSKLAPAPRGHHTIPAVDERPFALRVAIAAGSLAGLASLLLEDSGFKMSAVLGFPALMLWTLQTVREMRALGRPAVVKARPMRPARAAAPATPRSRRR